MNVKVFFLYLLAVWFLFSCGQDDENIVRLQPSAVISELSDSTFFKSVLCITHDSCHIYASDTHNGRILKFDWKMNYMGSIGAHGQGPEEFACLGGVACLNDTVYAIECTGLKVFTADSRFVRSAGNEGNRRIEPFAFCLDESGFIYLCSSVDTFPLVKYDTQIIRRFGFGSRQGSEDEKISGNQYMLQLFGDHILSVKKDDPFFTLYNRQGEALMNKRIDDRIFSSRLSFKKQEQEKDPANRKKTYGLFGAVTTSGNEVYLLYIYHDAENRPYCNRIARLVFENNDFHLAGVYQLPDAWYLAISLAGNRLVCYSGINEEFQIYEL
jgi:hypothetical protein